MKVSRVYQLLPWLVWALFFGLYSATAAPSITELFDDSLEFQLVGPTFGIAHPTGYPLYILLGALWSRVLFPFGNWAWRMNLLSALAAATTIALVFTLARRLVTTAKGQPNQWAGLAAALALGLSPIWWSQATIAEVYALHGLFVALILSVALGLDQPPAATAPGRGPFALTPRQKRFTLLCLLIGLSLTHHRTTVLLLPGIALYLVWSVPQVWRPQRAWLWWLLALLAPLLLYLLLPLRASMGVMDLHGSYRNTWQGFWQHILASGYSQTFFSENPLAKHYTAGDWLRLVQQQVGGWGIGIGLLGLAWLVDRRGRPAKAWLCLLLVLVSNFVFALEYKVSDAEVYLLPALLCFALFIGAGVGLLGRLWQVYPYLAALSQGLALLFLAVGIGGRGLPVNRSQTWAVHDYAVALAKVDFPPQSRVIGLEGEATALKYMQQAEGLGLNATALVADDAAARRQALATAMAAGQPTYLTRELNGIETRYSFSGEGPLVRVWPRGQSQITPPAHPLSLSLADQRLQLEGYDLDILAEAGGPTLRVAFYWRPVAPLTQTLKLSLRWQTLAGAPIRWPDGQAVTEDQFPLRQVALTPAWVVNEQLRDVHMMRIPTAKRGQPARLQVIVYDAATVKEVGRWQVDLTR